MLVFPAFWVALTLVRGAIVHVYPYDFVDVQANGYIAVVVTIIALTAAAGGLAVAAVSLDGRSTERVIRPFRRIRARHGAELALPHPGLPVDR